MSIGRSIVRGAFVALLGAACLLAVGCTRYGKNSPLLPTPSPSPAQVLYVSSTTGSDTNPGSSPKPLKTITKALKKLVPGGTITILPGHYNAANGEVFPLVFPADSTISGQDYGAGTASGVFIDGYGEDTKLEKFAGYASGKAYATVVIAKGTTATSAVTLSDVYIGTSTLKALPAGAFYASVDALGDLAGSSLALGAGFTISTGDLRGIVAPSGIFSCANCTIDGDSYAIAAFTVASASPPSVTLSGTFQQATIAGKAAGIETDGSATIEAAGQSFAGGTYAYHDGYTPTANPSNAPPSIDFGTSTSSGSSGGNVFTGASISEFGITQAGQTINALGDQWNQSTQGSSANGTYTSAITFSAPVSGKNVTISSSATGASLAAGPLIAPTATPSTSPTTSASPTASP